VRVTEATNFSAARAFVEFGLARQREGQRESASGSGSALAAAAQTLALLDEITQGLSIRTILDLGCGDWNWMKEAHWHCEATLIQYIGWESNSELVDQLQQRFGRPGISFHLKDVVMDAFPTADLMICRDVLFHLPRKLALRVVDKIARAGGLLLATTYPNEPVNSEIVSYLPIENWGYYPINLDIPPFNLGPRLRRQMIEPLCCVGDSPRAVCLYDFGGLANVRSEPSNTDPDE
jgi:SAM-dependent methyltransferase